MYYLQAIFICAVDTFILISGYFLCTSNKRSLWKPFDLILQVMILKLVAYLISFVIGYNTFSLKALIGCFIPANYFVILYTALFLISPFINLIIEYTTDNGFKVFMVLLIVLFSFWPTFVDVLSEIKGGEIVGLSTIGAWGSQLGYTIVNFVLVYLIGAWIRKNKCFKGWKSLLLLFILTTLLIMFFIIVEERLVGTMRISTAYCNPLVIVEAVLLFMIFKNFNFALNKCINGLAKGTFTVFIFHLYLLKLLNPSKYVSEATYLPHLIISTLCMYFASYAVYLVYCFMTAPIFIWLKDHIRLPLINSSISDSLTSQETELIDNLLSRQLN